MALKAGYTQEIIGLNIKKLMTEKFSHKQAISISQNFARKYFKEKHPDKELPKHLELLLSNPVKKRMKKSVKKKAKRRVSKRVGTSQNKPSMATRKKPSVRLKKRRAKNKKQGYFPNPLVKSGGSSLYGSYRIATINNNKVYYWTGAAFDTEKKKAANYSMRKSAEHIYKKIQIKIPKLRSLFVTNN